MIIRPRQREDTPSIVALYSAQEAELPLQTLEHYEAEHPLEASGASGEQWVAVYNGERVGYSSFHPAWWTEDPTAYSLELRVAERYGRHGVGTHLYEKTLSRLWARGATRLLCWVRDDATAGRSFAKKLGWRETGQTIQDYRLFTPDVSLEEFTHTEARLTQSGISIVTLAEAEHWGEPFLFRLHTLCINTEETSSEERSYASFLSWKAEALQGTGATPQTCWIAVEAGLPVGVTFLKRVGLEEAENDYTGVAPTHRGRGIATVLKGKAIAWAQKAGVRWFHTSSEVGNNTMIAINTRLGYRPGAVRHEMECKVNSLKF